MKRNANHQGSILYVKNRENTKPWRVVLVRDGTPHSKYFATEKEAEKYRNEIATQDRMLPKVGGTQSFEAYSKKWLAVKKVKLKRGTFDTLETNCNNHVCKYMGMKSIDQIDNSDMDKMLIALAEEGFSLAILSKCKNVVTACLRYAAMQHDISTLPIFSKEMPTVEHFPNLQVKKMKWLEPEQMKKYLDECYRLYSNGKPKHRNGPAYALLLHTGMRMGEGMALEWADYDRNSYRININKNAMKVKTGNKIGEGKRYETIIQHSPKSKAGDRSIPLTKDAVNDLEALERINGKSKYIMANSKGELLNSSDFLQGHYKICKAAGLERMGLHSLRHSYVTYKYRKGIKEQSSEKPFDPKALAAEIGHANVRTTFEIYTHLAENVNPPKRTYEELEAF